MKYPAPMMRAAARAVLAVIAIAAAAHAQPAPLPPGFILDITDDAYGTLPATHPKYRDYAKYRPATPPNPGAGAVGRACPLTRVTSDTTFEEWMGRARTNPTLRRKGIRGMVGDIFVIPVVVHVVHSDPYENIGEAQIRSQIDALNRDFRFKNHADTARVPPALRSRMADAKIEFALARTDPQGQLTDGIVRHAIPGAPFSKQDVDANIKPQTQWNPNLYLNLWVCNLGPVTVAGQQEELLGYAQLPTVPSYIPGLQERDTGRVETDGVVIDFEYFGTEGTVQPPFDMGRTATHEIGHWLGLRHVWGDKPRGVACAGDDFCADTPPIPGPHLGSGSKLMRQQCPGTPLPGLYENYMDYTDDREMIGFTHDQVARMRLVLEESPRRAGVRESRADLPPQQRPVPRPAASLRYGCGELDVEFRDRSLGDIARRLWEFPGGQPARSTDPAPEVYYDRPGTYPVRLTVWNRADQQATFQQPDFVVVEDESGSIRASARPRLDAHMRIHNPDHDATWEQAPSTRRPGSFIWRMPNFTNNLIHSRDWLLGPSLYLDTAASLHFDLAYSTFNARYADTLMILVSTGCDDGFKPIFFRGGRDLVTSPNQQLTFVPAATEWRHHAIDLSAYKGQHVRLAFVNLCGYSNNLYLENIQVLPPADTARNRGLPGSRKAASPSFTVEGSLGGYTAGETVVFRNTTPNAQSQRWDFAGGAPNASLALKAAVRYAYPGTYKVRLTVRFADGTEAVKEEEITVE